MKILSGRPTHGDRDDRANGRENLLPAGSRVMRVGLLAPSTFDWKDYSFVAGRPALRLTVLFCSSEDWKNPRGSGRRLRSLSATRPALNPMPTDAHTLSGYAIGRQDPTAVPHYLNPSVARWIRPSVFDTLVIAGWGFPTALLAAALSTVRGLPLVLRCESHWGSVRWGEGVAGFAKERLVRTLVSRADAFLPTGKLSSRLLSDLGARTDALFPMAVPCDVDAWREATERERHDEAAIRTTSGVGRGPVLSTVARFTRDKALDLLLRAFEAAGMERAGWSLVLGGDGPERSSLESLARRLQLERVIFTGPVGEVGIRRIFAISDLVCLPSRRETWGLVVTEALASGVPVISTDVVGAAVDLVADTGAGLVVPANDLDALVAALRSVVTAPKRLNEMQDATRHAVADIAHDDLAGAFIAACQYAIDVNHRTSRPSDDRPVPAQES